MFNAFTTSSITIARDLANVYNLWANLENFAQFLPNVTLATRTGERTCRWIMRGMVSVFELDVEITCQEPNRQIVWSSSGGPLEVSGQAVFRVLSPGETEVTVTLQYQPPAGLIEEIIAELFSELEKRLRDGLYRFKICAEGRQECLTLYTSLA